MNNGAKIRAGSSMNLQCQVTTLTRALRVRQVRVGDGDAATLVAYGI